MQIGDRLQQQVGDHAVTHRFIKPDFDFRDLLARHSGELREQLVRIARTERCRAVIPRFWQAAVQLRQRAADTKGRGRDVRQRRIRPLAPRVRPRQQGRLRVIQRLKAKARQRRNLAPAFPLALLQMHEEAVTGF